MMKRTIFVVCLAIIVGLIVFAWRPVSNYFADDACLDSGGAVGPSHTCRH